MNLTHLLIHTRDKGEQIPSFSSEGWDAAPSHDPSRSHPAFSTTRPLPPSTSERKTSLTFILNKNDENDNDPFYATVAAKGHLLLRRSSTTAASGSAGDKKRKSDQTYDDFTEVQRKTGPLPDAQVDGGRRRARSVWLEVNNRQRSDQRSCPPRVFTFHNMQPTITPTNTLKFVDGAKGSHNRRQRRRCADFVNQ